MQCETIITSAYVGDEGDLCLREKEKFPGGVGIV